MTHTSWSGPGATTPALEFSGIVKRFGDRSVLAGLDLRVDRGVHALLGANGAGKTTLLRILAGLERADAGTIRVTGVDAASDARHARRAVRWTGQQASVDEALTARENLRMFGRLLGLPARAAARRADELLERFALADAATTLGRRLSGGMRRRLDLATSLIDVPPVLVLDEPTTGLDPVSRAELWAVVRDLAGGGTTVLLTTQYLDEAEALADRVSILRGGRIAAAGTSAELTALVGRETVRLVRDDGATPPPGDGRGRDALVLRALETDGTAGSLLAALREASAAELEARVEIVRPTLDDVFAHLALPAGRAHGTDGPDGPRRAAAGAAHARRGHDGRAHDEQEQEALA